MSVARGFGLNGKSIYTNVTKPMDIGLQFTVTPTNSLGITSLKSNGYVRNVFMHTSTTPGSNDGYTNPNPAAGFALIQFQNNFNYYLNGFVQAQVPTATSTKIDNSALTAGQAYVITIVGNSTLAQWQAIGLPQGVTPAVGVSFIATAVGAGANTSTSRVELPTTSGILGVEVVGNPTLSSNNSNIASNGGAWLLLQFMGGIFTAGAYTPAGTISAPTFSGSALGTHTHNFTVIGGQAGSTTNDIANYAGPLLGKQEATDATYLGANSATAGGVVAASAGTPAGEVSAPTFTGSAASLTGTLALGVTAPATGSVICLNFRYDGSSVTIDGI
jgi:hypothetical protein